MFSYFHFPAHGSRGRQIKQQREPLLHFLLWTSSLLLCYVESSTLLCGTSSNILWTSSLLLCCLESSSLPCRATSNILWTSSALLCYVEGSAKKNIERCAEKNIKCSAEEGGKGFKGMSLLCSGSVFVIDTRWSRIKNVKIFPLWALTDRQKIATRFIVHSLQRYYGHVQE